MHKINVNMEEQITKAFFNSLFKKGEKTDKAVRGDGITGNYFFHPERLEEQRHLVATVLEELPEEFKTGDTFLKLCVNKNNVTWTGSHEICEQLMVLAIGLKLMAYCAPKEMWASLPEGLPYVRIA